MKDLAGKVAFITGGASGIGFGTAQECIAAGMRVVIADIRPEQLEAARAALGHRRPWRRGRDRTQQAHA